MNNKKRKKTSEKLIQLNKKGLVMDFGELYVAGALIVILAVILLLVMALKSDVDNKRNTLRVTELESSYSTRIILQQEIAPGYKVYNLIIDKVNEKDFKALDEIMPKIIDSYEPEGDSGPWFWYVNKHIGKYNTILVPREAIKVLPKTVIPNPNGEPIEVLIKKIKKSDYDIEELGLIRTTSISTGKD